MTENEFSHTYYEYVTHDPVKAILEAQKVNERADGFVVCAVEIGGSYTLMLAEAAAFLPGIVKVLA